MSVLTSRYARAFSDVVFEQKLDGNEIQRQVRGMVDLTEGSLELRRVWENPAIPAEQKRALLDAIAARQALLKQVRNFMAILIDHHRIGMLPEIARQFEHELHERMGLAEAEITSARELSEDERRGLEMQISSITGKRVLAKYSTDGALLGGAMVKVGSTIYDGSVRGQLQKLREQLSS
jgi:F-type H+-transporting ATPase subunit delta